MLKIASWTAHFACLGWLLTAAPGAAAPNAASGQLTKGSTATATAAPSPPPATSAPARGLDLSTFLTQQGSAFSEIDTNHDGTVDIKEFAASRERQEAERRVRQYRALFASLDANHDGALSVPEFMKLANPSRQADAKPEFDLLDSNRDGKLTRSEYLLRMTANFDRLDLNKDGTIDASELARSRQPQPGR